jgi:two-component system phosphate regulon sensor histidine kinase PhoR
MAGMVEGVLVLDLSGRILLVNPAFRELFDVWGPVVDRTLLEVLRLPEVDDLLRDASEANEPVVRDIAFRGAIDRRILGHAARFPSTGPPAGSLAVFHDVTELRRVDRVRRDFIANASHELRTPLTSIQGYAETLSGGRLSVEDQDRCLSTILRNVSRMRNLIDDLMDLSKIENDPGGIDRVPVDVVRVARVLIADLGKRLEAEGLTATLGTETSALAWGDRGAVEQVLENLLTNAIRYTDPGGQIRVDVETKADLLEVSVSDTGIGIPEESRDRIFERFYRVDAARSRAVGSTGLGLAIVRHLVQAMGGTVRVESELGVGSRFTFTLARTPENPARAPDAESRTPGENARTAGSSS